MAKEMDRGLRGLCVARTMGPGQRGAIKLTRRYGAALVCVRYRVSPRGRTRYTTVELLVDRRPVRARDPSERLVAVDLPRPSAALRAVLLESGARRIGGPDGRWLMTHATARRLGLTSLVTSSQ